MRRTSWVAGLSLACTALLLGACGGGGDPGAGAEGRAAVSATAGAELSAEEMKNGIGPIRHVELGEIDHEMVEQGEKIFETKCMACHRLDVRYVGPPLREVLGRRTPAYAMNMMLNSTVMVQKHPVAKGLLAQYYTPMPPQNLTEQDARALVEYLREMQKEGPGTGGAAAGASTTTTNQGQ